MATKFQKLVKNVLSDSTDIFPDKIICKNDGSVQVRRYYFYRHGNSSEKWAQAVENILAQHKNTFELDFNFSVKNEDHWNQWPKDSFFLAIVKEA